MLGEIINRPGYHTDCVSWPFARHWLVTPTVFDRAKTHNSMMYNRIAAAYDSIQGRIDAGIARQSTSWIPEEVQRLQTAIGALVSKHPPNPLDMAGVPGEAEYI